MAGPFLRTNAVKDAVEALVAEAGRSILCEKDMYFKPSIDPNVPPRLFTVVRHIRGRDSYEVKDKATQVMFPHTVTRRELSIGEKSRRGNDPLIRALVQNNLDVLPWLMEGERASSKSRSPPDLTRVSTQFVTPQVPLFPPGVSPPPQVQARPQYYAGHIPVPLPGAPPQMPYPPGFTPGSGPQPYYPSSAPIPRGPPPPGPWAQPPFAPPVLPAGGAAPIPPAGPPGFDPFLDLSTRLANIEASRVAEAKRLADLEANRSRTRNSPLSVEGEAFCRSLAANALIQGGKPGLLSQMSAQLDVCLAPAEQQPFINLAILGLNVFRLRNMKLAFLGENLINKAYEIDTGDLGLEPNRRKVEQAIISYYRDQQVVATNLVNKYPDKYSDKPQK